MVSQFKGIPGFQTENEKTLLCHGIPGAGKTVMASIVVDHIQALRQKNPAIGIAYFYFSYDSTSEQTSGAVTGCLIRQLLELMPDIPAELQILSESHEKHKTRPSLKDLHISLKTAIRMYSKVFIVLDALDEYHAGDSARSYCFLDELLKLQKLARFKIFATTRINSEIISQFEPCLRSEIRAHREDIRTYIHTRMTELRKIKNQPDLQSKVHETILRSTDGMFLLARLHMDALKEPVTLGSFKRCLNSLPNGAKGLNETYNQAMKRIDGQGEERQELARRILYWIVYTRRTLTIAELIDALAISYDLGGSKLDHDLRPEVDDIDSLCAGLVSADTNAGIVRLVHKTTQEYFTNVNAFPDAHRQILKVCITFLCYNEIWNTGPRNTREPRSQGHTGQNTKNICEAVSPIGIYAIEEWHTHAAAMHDGWDEVQQFLFSPSKAIHVSTCMRYLLHVEQRKRPPTYLECHGIHLVAYLGLHKLMDRLVHFGEAVDTKDSEGNTPLYYAATCGHLKSVRFLLWLQPSPDKSFDCAFCFSESVNKKGLWKSLCIAVVGGHLQVVEEFINLHGMDETARRVISTLQKHPLNPLDAAARHGHTDILALLLKRWGSWISDAFQDWAVGALAVAVEGACVSTVRLILEKRKEHACIYNAIYGKIHEKWILQMTRNKNIIEMLAYCYLEDQRWEEYDFGLLLFHQSAVVGLERIVKQLIPRVSQNHNLVAPAHVHELYSTMMIASQHRHTTILDLIFDNFHIDPYLDWMDGSFMYNAIFGNQTEIFARLTSLSSLKPSYSDQWNVLTEAMKAGADIWQWRSFPVDSNQNEPEQYTLFANILSGKRGLSIDIRNDSGHTPLIKAIMTGFNGVDFLRKQGVDLNERDQCGLSALSHAAIKYSQRFYFLEDLRKMRATNFPLFCLLEMPEVDITSKDNEGHTALWWAIRSIDTYFEDEKDQEEPDICAQDKAVEMLLKKGSVVPDDESMKLIAKRLQGDGLTMSDTWPEEFLQEITEMYKRIEKMMQDKLASVQSAQVSERSTT